MLAVIIEYALNPGADAEFGAALTEMVDRVQGFDGYLGELPCHATHDEGHRATISYWRDAEALKAWRIDPAHMRIQEQGRTTWLAWYRVRVLALQREYGSGDGPSPLIIAESR
ncbi:MAG TPA: antibiotic biosynthesis monooxygenase [Alphaproteobacteria bacterium]|nr:antibiotic biosynthesis monooxygenase [Alphaproteobacteria bacterium]